MTRDEDYPQGNVKWKEWYMAKECHDGNEHEHFLACFLQYLRHAEGGLLSEEQSLIQVRQVHKVLETMDKDGKNVLCLTWSQGMKIWHKFCVPNLRGKLLTGNTVFSQLNAGPRLNAGSTRSI